ncbi:chemotaxis protein CheC [Paenalkalicoccus suaedae]|uniref:Chemotaxis protein CheC n=1 Tax=Paenalkalicoccus suaedae TaxID=2592382 RepID=A0A859FBM5_9BACI|nr:chemotaxis protein CheC [Paenalkalicoccus suaedae]QKS70669.1 chemotaxis protein CheC [Paenalkalicoccus suaedae]
MNATHINAVCRATKTIMTSHLGVDLTPNKPHMGIGSIDSNDVAVVLGVSGELSGQIICSLTSDTAKKIVGTMMGGMTVDTLDEIGWSAIQEFGNWVAGSTATELSKESCIIDVTPPVVNEGASRFHSARKFITIPMGSTLGLLHVHISLEEQSA